MATPPPDEGGPLDAAHGIVLGCAVCLPVWILAGVLWWWLA